MVKNTYFQNVMACKLEEIYQPCGDSCCLLLQGRAVSHKRKKRCRHRGRFPNKNKGQGRAAQTMSGAKLQRQSQTFCWVFPDVLKEHTVPSPSRV
jgi:hypothetical protein